MKRGNAIALRWQIVVRVILLLMALMICDFCAPRSNRYPRGGEKSYHKPYSQKEEELKATMFLFHGLNNTTFLYYKIKSEQLLYSKGDTGSRYLANVKVNYILRSSPDARQVIDSGAFFIQDQDTQVPAGKLVTGYFPLNVKDSVDLYLEAKLLDLKSRKAGARYIHCYKMDVYSQQNFLVRDTFGNVIFSNKIAQGNVCRVSNQRAAFSFASVSLYHTDYSLPPPPYSSHEPNLYPAIPDSVFDIFPADSHNFQLNIRTQGLYFIRLDAKGGGGCMLLGVEPNFPLVQNRDQMIAATRFIMNKDEYAQMVGAADKKAAIEKFWLGIGGNQDRARQLIKRYYGRVQDANTLFTSHIEGWKTDMGMIYIIFGSPTNTYKTAGMETWQYGQEGTPGSVSFQFEKVMNPFSENCYKLRRNPNFRDPWILAADNWREGRVSLDD